ncbi:SDR family oxidoreductase [Pseudactinotalea sp. HY158]|uniref:SDR family oxidoreductase n=1 Tax=Pseudactinotalea sp. HY158 TaxID=2654547 RepID=UPI00129CAF2F|nr:SDR family oxidoreductase [Pseudactinotalea sp. HY158]QGH69993.1 SDR family NAD(P)-dependent oxidoreductase [Pseudactinotalea sp. HY158]
MQRRDLTGTVIAVTGAGSGIGRASAEELIDARARLALGDLRAESLTALAEEHPGADLAQVAMDAGTADGANRLVAAAVAEFGHLDSIVINAGVGYFGGITDWDDEQIEAMVATNVAGTMWATRAAVRQFDAQGRGGDIVLIASVAGLAAANSWEAVYAATKHAQVGFAATLAREVTPRGVRVSVIAPAAVHTRFAFGTGRTEDDPELDAYMRPSDIAFAVRTVLEQPRRLRTALWSMWSMAEQP